MAFKTIFATESCAPSLATVSACNVARAANWPADVEAITARRGLSRTQRTTRKEGERKTARLRRRNMTLTLSLSFLAPSFAHKGRLDGGQKMKTRAGRNNDAAAVCVNIANTTRRACRLPRSTLVCCTSVLPSFLRGRRPRPSHATAAITLEPSDSTPSLPPSEPLAGFTGREGGREAKEAEGDRLYGLSRVAVQGAHVERIRGPSVTFSICE